MYPKGSRPMIAGTDPELPAAKAGMHPGDVLVSIKDTVVRSSEEVIGIVRGNPAREIAIAWERDGRPMSGKVTPNSDGKIGIVIVNDIAGPKETRHYGIGEAASLSARGVWSIASLTVQSIWRVIEGKASFRQQISGPVKIAKMAAQQAEVGLVSFLNLVAVLSISLAVINILPLPALDGGYVMFLLFEAVFRREVKLGVQYYLLQFGWFLLIGLMVFVLYNDIFH
jgi:regulator of sigma E protease